MGLEKDVPHPLRHPERRAAVSRAPGGDRTPAPDRLTRLAARLLGCPASLLCLVEGGRLSVAATHGPTRTTASGSRQTPLDSSFCQLAVLAEAPFTVEDARDDPAFRTVAMVAGLGLVAYAGTPLVALDGRTLGTLGVLDVVPRRWTDADLADLTDLAASAAAELFDHTRGAPALPGEGAGLAGIGSIAAAARLAQRLGYDALPGMIWTANPDGVRDYVNARWLAFSGRSLGAELGLGWAELVHADDRDAHLQRFRQAVARREPLQLEYRARRHDGQFRWLRDVAVPRLAPDGAFVGMIGCTTDVTHRRALEQRLVRAERAQAIGQLAGGIAHDFNNLLTGISGHATLLQEDPGLSEVGREDLAQIQRSADRAASLTRQLLAFSRRQVLSPRVLDVNQLVSGCLSTLRLLVGDRVQITARLGAALDPIVADPGQLEQMLTQLCINARESMPEGGTLEIATRQERLDATAGTRLPGLRPGVYVRLEVRDTGHGMDGPTVDRVFEPCFSTKAPSEGAGLGLAAVYGIVKQSGGHIEVSSEAAKGTTFTVYLPRHEGSGPAGGAGTREPAGGTETILLVEDEEQVRELARRVLERAGYTVLAAPDAQAAMAMADRRPGHIHLLVTDMLLPHLGGRELAARLSIHRPAIKVLYISGTSDGSIARLRLLEPGMQFLDKPFSLDRLLRTVRHALGEPGGKGHPA